MMLRGEIVKKINILKENKDFDRIIKNNHPFKSRYFLIFVEKNQINYHFGISVSKKICNAVGRNKIKRQIRNIIDTKDYQKNFNCIIIVKKSILQSDYLKMENDLISSFYKLNLIKGEKNETKCMEN